MDTSVIDPLTELIVDDAQAINRQRLTDILKKFVFFDKLTKSFNFTEEFSRLPSNLSKLEMVFLANKAKSLLFDSEEGLTQKNIIDLVIMPEGSVKSTLKRMIDEKIVLKNKTEKYYVPTYFLEKIMKKYE